MLIAEQWADCGVVYAAAGAKYVRECLSSLESLRRVCAWVSVTIFTDDVRGFPLGELEYCEVRKLTDAADGFGFKIAAMRGSPYGRSLFLDTDTRVLGNPEILFALLDRFDLAVAMETYRAAAVDGVPEGFPEFNTGVVVFRRAEVVTSFLSDWEKCYSRRRSEKVPPKHDQPSFREVLYSSDVRLVPLPSEWNFCVTHPAILNAGALIQILHSHEPERSEQRVLRKVAEQSRVFLPGVGELKPSRVTVFDRRWNFWFRGVLWPLRFLGLFFGKK
ncbi:MAG: hypothetical protein WCS31_01445 [Verrucomicrobiae bacterium]